MQKFLLFSSKMCESAINVQWYLLYFTFSGRSVFTQFTLHKPVSLFCVLWGTDTLWQQPRSVCVLAILDQMTFINHNYGVLPHDWFCKVGDTVCVLLLHCFCFIFPLFFDNKKISLTAFCWSKCQFLYHVCLLVSPPLWIRLKYLNYFLMDYHEI